MSKYVLDASAVLALLNQEPGMDRVELYELRLAERKAGKSIRILPTLKKYVPAHP